MEFLTDKIRANIYKKCVNRDNLETFFDGNQGDFNFEMLLIDYYNILMFKRTTNDITQYEINNLELINKYTVKELKGLICDFQFVKSLLTAGISFYELARLDRQQIVRISHDWHNKNDLTSRVLYHINYMSNIPSYDLQTLIDYYVEYININGKDLITHDEGADIIIQYLSELKLSDENKYDEFLLYATSYYYRLMTFLKRDCRKDICYQDIIFLKKIEIYGVKSLLRCIKKDEELLSDVIKQCLYYKTLSEPVVEEADGYLDKKLSKRIKRKLNNLSGNN